MAKDTEVLKFAVELDPKKAIKAAKQLQTSWQELQKIPKDYAKDSKKSLEGVLTNFNKLTRGMEDFNKAALQAKKNPFLDSSQKGAIQKTKNLSLMFARLNHQTKALAKAREKVQAKWDDAKASGDTAELTKQARILGDMEAKEQKLLAAFQKEAKAASSIAAASKVAVAASAQILKEASENLEEYEERSVKRASELRKELMGYGGEEFGKDFTENLEGGMSALASKSGGDFAKSVMGLLKSGGKGLAGISTRMQAKAAITGKEPGMMGKAAGAAGAGIGKIMGVFSKLGPVIGLVSSAVVGLVKLFIDAQAAAKEFNKEILTGASTAEFLAASGGKSAIAFANLEDTMKQLRDAAFDYTTNTDLGISSKEHAAFTNTLAKEGVSLKQITDEAARSNKSVGDFEKTLITSGVVYSRVFGVSLDEIASLQATMQADLGVSLKTATDQFAEINIAMKDSGIAANKFFGIVRNLSSDMGFFNLRMAEAGKLLKLVSKSMNAKQAEKFIQNLSGHFKGQSYADRIRATLVAGKGQKGGAIATAKNLEGELQGKIKTLATEAQGKGVNPEGLRKAIAAGGKDLTDFMAANAEKMTGAMRSEVIDASKQSQLVQGGKKGDLFSSARGLKNAGPIAALKQLDSIAGNMFEGKKFNELSGKEHFAMTNLPGGGTEELMDEVDKFRKGVAVSKAEMLNKIKNDKALSEDEGRLLAQLGLTGKSKEEISKGVAGADEEDFFNSMSADQKRIALEGENATDFAKKQTGLTDTLISKLERLSEFLMNKYYNIIVDVYDALTDMPGMGGSSRKEQIRQETLSMGGGKQMLDMLTGGRGTLQGLQASYSKETDPQKQAQLAIDVNKQQMAVNEASGKVLKAITGKGGTFGIGTSDAEMAQKAGVKAGLSEDMNRNFSTWIKKGKTGEEAAKLAGLSDDQMARVAAEAMKTMDVQALRTVTSWGVTNTGVGATPTASTPGTTQELPPPAPEAQKTAEETAKAAQAQVAATEEQTKVLDTKGIKLDKPFLKTKIGPQVEESTLSALRTALFEFYVLQHTPLADVAEAIKGGLDPKSAGEKLVAGMKEQGSAFNAGETVKANAAGGTVMRPAPGEAFASVAPGETIVPKGGGAGGITINVNVGGAPLATIIEGKVKEGIEIWQRREAMRALPRGKLHPTQPREPTQARRPRGRREVPSRSRRAPRGGAHGLSSDLSAGRAHPSLASRPGLAYQPQEPGRVVHQEGRAYSDPGRFRRATLVGRPHQH